MNLNINYDKYIGEIEPFAEEVRTYIYGLRDSIAIFPLQENAPCSDGEGRFWCANYDLEYEYKNDVIFVSYNEQYAHPARFFLKDVIFTNGKVKFICENGATFYIEDEKIVRNICNNPSGSFEQFKGKKSVLENHLDDIKFRNDKQYGWLNKVDTYLSRNIIECIHDGVTTFIVAEERIQGFTYMGKHSPFPFKYENNGNLCYSKTECQLIPEVKYENKNDVIFYWGEEQRMFHTRFYLKDIIVANSKIMFACENGTLVEVYVGEDVHDSDFKEMVSYGHSDVEDNGILFGFYNDDGEALHKVHEDNAKNSQTLYNRYKGKQSILAHYLDNVEFRSDMCYGWSHKVDSYITKNIIECIHDGVTTFIVPVEATEGLLCVFPC